MENVDAVFVSYADYPILGTGSPNKFFDGLAAGKVIFTNVKGWFQQIIEGQECGFFIPRTQNEKFLEVVKDLLGNPELRKKISENSRNLAEKEFSLDVQLPKWYTLFEEVNA